MTYQGYKYKVTGIADHAFRKNAALKKITIGSNIKKVGKRAFLNSKKLKTIIFKGKKVPKLGSNAFKGIRKNAVFKVPRSAQKKYKRALNTKAGIKKTMRIVRV